MAGVDPCASPSIHNACSDLVPADDSDLCPSTHREPTIEEATGREWPRVIREVELHSVSVVTTPLHPSWRIETIDGKYVGGIEPLEVQEFERKKLFVSKAEERRYNALRSRRSCHCAEVEGLDHCHRGCGCAGCTDICDCRCHEVSHA